MKGVARRKEGGQNNVNSPFNSLKGDKKTDNGNRRLTAAEDEIGKQSRFLGISGINWRNFNLIRELLDYRLVRRCSSILSI